MSRPPPLRGVCVLELANYMAGPYCGMLLADMGAEVIKIENPAVGDYTRENPPFIKGESAGFLALNRNKKSVALNLKHERGRDVFLKLAELSDVILENFRPGTMRDLGIDYDTVKKLNPRIVYASASGFGQSGPYSQRPGLDLIAQGMSGLMSITGEDGGRPVKVGVPLCDLTAALFTTYGIVSALIARERDGEGQFIDVSLFESGVALEIWETSAYFATGKVPQRLGTAHQVNAPYQAYRTSDGYVTIGAQSPGLWPAFCRTLELEHLVGDPRFDTVEHRKDNERELAVLIEQVTARESSEHWYRRLEATGVPCGVLNDIGQVVQDEHLKARGFLVEMEHPLAGRVQATGSPVHLSGTPIARFSPAPLLGQHTESYLSRLGMTTDEIDRLREAGVVKVEGGRS
jgi:crotonobetainyl-CoA:carnitine CoA-transferase CaiB-like acyl-CoA transferase